MINVTDLSMYLYCPRKFFLEKIKGLRSPPSKQMIEGKIRHEVLEAFSNNEKDFVLSLEQINKNKVLANFHNFLFDISSSVLSKNLHLIKSFSINKGEITEKIINSMKNDIQLRAESIENTMAQGFLRQELWENLNPKYISEMPIQSESLGLRGRIDRLMILGKTIIPFELKTREIEKIYDSDEIQLTAYAMLLEEHYNIKIPIAILEAGNKKHELAITEENKQKVIDLIKEVNELKNQKTAKFPSNFAKCQSCFFQKQCEEF